MASSSWIDITIPLREGIPCWPGDPPFRLERVCDVDKGHEANVTAVSMSLHTGTHVDPPLHYLRGGASLDRMPLDATVGRARVIAIEDRTAIGPVELRRHAIRAGERLLFKTRNSAERLWERDGVTQDYVAISPDGARHLVDCGVLAVGVDSLSVGAIGEEGAETHRILLGGGVWVMEGLNLERVEPGEWELICLPLLVVNSDGAPARVILRPWEAGAGE